MNQNDFVLYFHINPLKNHIFYVGIGTKKRPYNKQQRSNFQKYVVKKYGYIVDIVHENLSQNEACKLEKFYINKIGRKDLKKGNLVNMTDGGDGSFGYIPSKETREKMSKSHKENPRDYVHSEDTKKKMSKPRINLDNFNRSPLSQKHKDNISEANTGKSAQNKNLKGYLKGKKLSQEHKNKISKGNKGKSRGKGNIHSKESKLKISITKNKYKKTVLQYDLNNNFINEQESATLIKNILNYNNISSCCKTNLDINKKCQRYGYIQKQK